MIFRKKTLQIDPLYHSNVSSAQKAVSILLLSGRCLNVQVPILGKGVLKGLIHFHFFVVRSFVSLSSQKVQSRTYAKNSDKNSLSFRLFDAHLMLFKR